MTFITTFTRKCDTITASWIILAVFSILLTGSFITLDYACEFGVTDELLSPAYSWKFDYNDNYIRENAIELINQYPELKCNDPKLPDNKNIYFNITTGDKNYIVICNIRHHTFSIAGIIGEGLPLYSSQWFTKTHFWQRWPICLAFKKQVLNPLKNNMKSKDSNNYQNKTYVLVDDKN